MSENDIKAGSVIQLKSGGPHMTVSQIGQGSTGRLHKRLV